MSWSKEDLIVCPILHLLVLALALTVYFIFRKTGKKTKSVIIDIVAIVFVVLEIGKQWECCNDGYDMWDLPFHFCSFFSIWILFSVISFGKLKDFFRKVAYIWALFISVSIIILPEPIYGGAISDFYNNGDFFQHTIVFHELVIFYAILVSLFNINTLKLKEILYMPLSIIIYGCFAIPSAYLLQTNYCCILKFVPGTVLEDFRIANGQIIYDGLLFGAGILGAMLLFFIVYVIQNKNKQKIIQK